jgi:hypothetical protein
MSKKITDSNLFLSHLQPPDVTNCVNRDNHYWSKTPSGLVSTFDTKGPVRGLCVENSYLAEFGNPPPHTDTPARSKKCGFLSSGFEPERFLHLVG